MGQTMSDENQEEIVNEIREFLDGHLMPGRDSVHVTVESVIKTLVADKGRVLEDVDIDSLRQLVLEQFEPSSLRYRVTETGDEPEPDIIVGYMLRTDLERKADTETQTEMNA